MSIEALDQALDRLLFNNNSNNQVYHGNCLDIMDRLNNNSVHLIVTDPPYFIDGMCSNWNVTNLETKKGKAKVVGGLPVGMKFDKQQGIKLQQFFGEVSKKAYRVLMPGSFFLVFSSPRLSHRMAVAIEDEGFEIRDMYAWRYRNKSQAKAFTLNHFVDKMKINDKMKNSIIKKLGGRKTAQLKPQYETIIVAQKPREGTMIDNWLKYETGLVDLKNTRLNGHTPNTVLEVDKPNKESYNTHLTVKPVSLIEALINLFSKKNQIVLDPFLGSGTTLLATRFTERQGIGIEINQDYIEVIKKRLGIIDVKT